MVNSSPNVTDSELADEEGVTITGKLFNIKPTDGPGFHDLYNNNTPVNNDNHNSLHTTQYINTKTLNIFHQNIRGLKYKTDELLCALGPVLPHVLCLS